RRTFFEVTPGRLQVIRQPVAVGERDQSGTEGGFGLALLRPDRLERRRSSPPQYRDGRQANDRQDHKGAEKPRDRRPAPSPLPGSLPRGGWTSLDGFVALETPQVIGEGDGARVAPTGFLVQALQAYRFDVMGKPRPQAARRQRFARSHLLQRFEDI